MPVVVSAISEDFDQLVDLLAREAGVDRATIIRRGVAVLTALSRHRATHGHVVLSRTPGRDGDIELVNLLGPDSG